MTQEGQSTDFTSAVLAGYKIVLDYNTLRVRGLDPKTQDVLREARRRVPRFLFRGWSNAAGNPSGGYQGLNTPSNITPLAYRFYPAQARQDFFEFDTTCLRAMVDIHITEITEIRSFATEFSSWGASLQTALHFARHQSAYLSIVDTWQLEQDGNFVLHLPDLIHLVPKLKDLPSGCEYFVHGTVGGSAHRAVPVELLRRHQAPFLGRAFNFFEVDDGPPCPIGLKEVLRARAVGEAYGGNFVVPVTLAVLCSIPRRSQNSHDNTAPDTETIAMVDHALASHVIPEAWRGPSTTASGMDFALLGDVKQMTVLMRALIHRRTGRETH